MKQETKESIYKIFAVLFVVAWAGAIIQGKMMNTEPTILHAQEPQDTVVEPTGSPSPTPVPEPEVVKTSEYEQMEAIVREVFGDHAEVAFKLLKCENRGLNPNATNKNYDERKTTDWGLFQINDYWQGVRHAGKAEQFLLDPEINARIAWRLYEDDGYSFKLWTCGKELGI